MALKQSALVEPWAAVQVLTNNTVINYSGSGTIWKDSLEVSINDSPGALHPFRSDKQTMNGSIMSCPKPPSNGKGKYCTVPGPSSFLQYSGGKAATPPHSDTQLWARSNPSRPVFLLPVFWLELREVPDMLRQAGRFLLHAKNWRDYVRPGQKSTRDLAVANLAFQFGWAPLVGDLAKIASFQASVDKRRKKFDALYSEKGLRQSYALGSTNENLQAQTNCNFGSYRNFSVKVEVSRSARKWAVLYWRATESNRLPPSDRELRRLLTGFDPSHITANIWEALPWSWLIDYFANVGDVINAGNHNRATPNGGVVMTQYTTIASHGKATQGLDVLSPGVTRKIENNRQLVAGASLGESARIPVLGAGQLSILGSLAILKGRKTLLS